MTASSQILMPDVKLLRFITAGSVDDGKSTLIGRLLYDSKSIFEDQLSAIETTTRRRGADRVDLSLLTDGLLAEREQGITIDVAYRYFSTPRRKFIVADTPGHEQYTRNMVTGASTANLAIVLIDACHGVLVQSRRHAYLTGLIGIPHLIVAINKMDLVGYSEDVFNAIREEFDRFVVGLKFRTIDYIPISALQGDMVVDRGAHLGWYDGSPLLERLETIEIDHDLNRSDFRFPVQLVCRPQNPELPDFRGYMGRIESGEIAVGDEVKVLPSGRTSKIKAIVTLEGNLKRALAPQSVTLTIEDHLDISRGDLLVKALDAPLVAQEFDAEVCWFAEQPLDLKRRYIIKQTTKSVRVSVSRLDYRVDINTLCHDKASTLAMNEIGRLAIKTQQPLVFDSYTRNRSTGSFILIDEATNNTVAAGIIQ
jgi:sulfate adenylyltransferase subunit 1